MHVTYADVERRGTCQWSLSTLVISSLINVTNKLNK